MAREDELLWTVVEKVADRKGVDPVDLESPLYETFDTDALQALLDSADPDGPRVSVTFTYGGYAIQVDDSGTVRVTGSCPDADPAKAGA
ncbi:HalOD1 output domain-containing protein [Salinilacihabitans rarus]|uniref:HalOD1 output domain-containing protein n=1 Tax=Salinilacihabitans rarus TaxID=2961596 RepID=UPI0020C849FE|nr:HalOD1 output domain-containing protein [Salinilacihabitans rarus]